MAFNYSIQILHSDDPTRLSSYALSNFVYILFLKLLFVKSENNKSLLPDLQYLYIWHPSRGPERVSLKMSNVGWMRSIAVWSHHSLWFSAKIFQERWTQLLKCGLFPLCQKPIIKRGMFRHRNKSPSFLYCWDIVDKKYYWGMHKQGKRFMLPSQEMTYLWPWKCPWKAECGK